MAARKHAPHGSRDDFSLLLEQKAPGQQQQQVAGAADLNLQFFHLPLGFGLRRMSG